MQSASIDNDYDAPELASMRRGAMVDGVLHFVAYGTALSMAILAPNIVQALDGPLAKLDTTMDQRRRKREILKTVYYMKSRGYLAGDYEHGLQLTGKAKRQLAKRKGALSVAIPERWDKHWRVIVYDIPEKQQQGRRALTRLLREMGCFQLQKSTWITPFSCRDVIAIAAAEAKVDQYVTYLEATYLDNQQPLLARFSKKYPTVDFHAGGSE